MVRRRRKSAGGVWSPVLLSVVACVLFPPASAVLAQDHASSVATVRVGDRRTFSLDFALGDVTADAGGQFASAVEADGAPAASNFELRVEGRAVGREVLLLHDAAGAVRRRIIITVVEPAALERCAEQLRALLVELPEVEVQTLHTRVLVRGLALSAEARERVYRTLDASPPLQGPCAVLVLLELADETEVALAGAVNDELRAMHLPAVHAGVRDHRLVLQGAVGTEDALQQAQQIGASYDPAVVNMVVIRPPTSRKEAAVAARRALKSAGYDLLVLAENGHIVIEGAVATMADRTAVETLARARVGPHAAAVILRVVIR